MRRRASVTVMGLAAVVMLTGASRVSEPRGASEITAAQLKDYLTFISSDEMEGRDTPSRGLDITARFLALQLARAGAEPAGDNGTYFQRIGLTRRKVDPETTTAVLITGGGRGRARRSREASRTARTFWPRRCQASPRAA